MDFSIILIAVLALGLFAALLKISKYREDRKKRGLFRPWPIKQVDADKFDDRFTTGKLGPSRDSVVKSVSNFRVEGGISDFETWFLCNLAKKCKSIFELGTCTGKTTYLLAANSPEYCRITTITLKPENITEYKTESGDDEDAVRAAAQESQFDEFYYSNTPEEKKIIQLFGDSKTFDDSKYESAFDLIFVDGSHAYSYVKSDSEKALRMVRPGGVVVWHDYCGPRRAKGVFRALNELSRQVPLLHIKGTTMVVYRRPA